jgi:hypothetical protein
MPNEPIPLREALAEAVAAMVTLASDFIPHETQIEAEYRQQVERAGALVEQIPIIFEAREGDDG